MSKRAEALIIRSSESQDHDALEELQQRTSAAFPLAPFERAKSQVLVAELDGEIAGFARIVAGKLSGPFVKPEYWRKGIGRALIDEATHEARRRGLALIVDASRDTFEFYRKCGFRIEGETEALSGPLFLMSR